MNVVVGKNYRVQNIQLSKIRLAGLCRQSVNVGSVGSPLCAALATSPTSVGARLKSLTRSPKLFSKNSLCALRFGAISQLQ